MTRQSTQTSPTPETLRALRFWSDRLTTSTAAAALAAAAFHITRHLMETF